MSYQRINQERSHSFPLKKPFNEEANYGQERFIDINIRIIDNGCGISAAGQKNLFIDFGKLDENSQMNREGTGLGLSICKQIIEQQGGSVRVKSKLGKGTEFQINMKSKCIVRETQFKDVAVSMHDVYGA